jgi:hypothetical protein
MAASDPRSGPVERPTPPETALVEFANEIVNRLSTVGLRLAGAQALVGGGVAGQRIAAAIDELDRTTRDIRTTVYEHTGRRLPAASGTAGERPGGVC